MLRGMSAPAARLTSAPPRHAAFVRATHWITALCFFALLLSGLEIVVSHPRFYWGETGNSGTATLFKIPIPSSRATVPSGYNYVLPDQNGWSRSLHFQAAWAAVLTGALYLIWGLWTGHFRSNLFPAQADRNWGAVVDVMMSHLRFKRPTADEEHSYNVLQRTAYLAGGVHTVSSGHLDGTGLVPRLQLRVSRGREPAGRKPVGADSAFLCHNRIGACFSLSTSRWSRYRDSGAACEA